MDAMFIQNKGFLHNLANRCMGLSASMEFTPRVLTMDRFVSVESAAMLESSIVFPE